MNKEAMSKAVSLRSLLLGKKDEFWRAREVLSFADAFEEALRP